MRAGGAGEPKQEDERGEVYIDDGAAYAEFEEAVAQDARGRDAFLQYDEDLTREQCQMWEDPF